MNLIKRAIIFIKRNYKRTVQLFLIIFLLGNFMCIVSSIKSTTYAISDAIKDKIGSIVIYKDSRYNDSEYGIKSDEDLNDLYKYEHILKEISKHEFVKYSNYSYMMKLDDDDGYLRYGYGVSSTPIVDVLENEIKIIEGREFTKTEIENRGFVVLVSKGSIYKGKEIEINDEIKMVIQNNEVKCDEFNGCEINIKKGEEYTLKVIGLFEKKEKAFDYQKQDYDNISNRWYLPNSTLLEIFEKKRNLSNYEDLISSYTLGIDKPFIRLKDSKNLNVYINDIRPLLLNEKDDNNKSYDYLYTSNDEFETIFLPIKILPILGNILLIGSSIIFSVLLGLLLISIIKERIYEIGVLLSLGERKHKVIVQLFIELMIIGMLAISCSFLTGKELSNFTYDYLLSKEMVEEVESIKNIERDYIYLVYEYSCGVIILSLIYPSFIIFKQNPKEILLK